MQTKKMSFSEFETMTESEMKAIMAGSGTLVSTPGVSPNPFWGSNFYNLYTFIQPSGTQAGSYSNTSYSFDPTNSITAISLALGVSSSTYDISNKLANMLGVSTSELVTLSQRMGWVNLGASVVQSVYDINHGGMTINDAINIVSGAICIAVPGIAIGVSVSNVAYNIAVEYYRPK